MILQHLQRLGFTENEVRIYLALMELGKAGAAVLSKKTALPRTTAYSVLENLVRKGVISEEKDKHLTYFVVNRPGSLVHVLEQERTLLKAKEESVHELMNLLTPYFKSTNYSIPKFQFFDGRENVQTMLYDYFDDWMRSIEADDSVWWGYQDHTFAEQYLPYLEYYWKKRPPKQQVRLFSNQSAIEKKLKDRKVPRRIVRPVPLDIHFTSTIWVLGAEYIVLVMTRQKPHFAFQIKDKVFGSNLRSVFNWLWTLTERTAR